MARLLQRRYSVRHALFTARSVVATLIIRNYAHIAIFFIVNQSTNAITRTLGFLRFNNLSISLEKLKRKKNQKL